MTDLKKNKLYTTVTCHECSIEFQKSTKEVTRSSKLLSNHFCTLSCSAKYRNKKHGDKRHSLPWWASDLFGNAGKRAAKSKMEFNLSEESMSELVLESGGYCQVSGIKFDFSSTVDKNKRRPYYPSLDRIDSTKGYIKSNLRLVCIAANYAMNVWGEECLHELARAVVSYNHLSVTMPSVGGKTAKGVYETRNGKFTAKYRSITVGTFLSEAEAIRAREGAIRQAKL